MVITKLSIRNFRNIASLELEPGDGVNVIYGDNAQGKTNLVEALFLLTGQKSFRQTKESEFVRFGEKKVRSTPGFLPGGGNRRFPLLWKEGSGPLFSMDYPLGWGS